MLVVGDEVVEVELDVLKFLRVPGNGADGGLLALEITTEDTAARVPDKVVGPRVAQGLHVAPVEGIERIANGLDLLVEAKLRSGFCHDCSFEPNRARPGPPPGITTPQSRL